MFCKNCGQEIEENVKFCPYCGSNLSTVVNDNLQQCDNKKEKSGFNENVSPKSRTVAALLAFFLGGLGIHRFYVGKIGTGILQILVTCCFGLGCVWALIDFIIILCGNFRDSQGLVISDWDAKY